MAMCKWRKSMKIIIKWNEIVCEWNENNNEKKKERKSNKKKGKKAI